MKNKHLLVALLAFLTFMPLSASTERDLHHNLSLAQKDKSLADQTNHCIALAEYYLQQKSFESALNYYQQAYDLSQKRKHKEDQVFVAVAIGNVLDQKGELAEALHWYNIAMELAQVSLSHKYISHIHNNIGNLYVKMGSFTAALTHYQSALDLKREQGDQKEIANALINMSIFYLKTGNYPKSLENQMQALKLYQESGDRAAIASTYNSISVCHRHLKNYNEAFEFNRKALELYHELGNVDRVASAYNNLGVLYLAINDLSQAKAQYLKAYQLKSGSKDMQSVLSSLINLADVSLKLKQYQDTYDYLSKASEIQSKTQYFSLTRTLYKIYADYYEEIGNYDGALRFFKAYQEISDSLFNQQKTRQMQELEAKYDLREKERNIELLTRNNELTQMDLRNSARLRNYLIVILSLILLITVTIIWRYTSVLRLSRKLYASREKLNTINLELERRVEIEVERRRQQEQKALRQSRLALLGELAAGIAHELNQPMQTLSLTLENIKLSFLDNSFSGEYLEQKLEYLFADITRMEEVIEHIRRFSRQSEDPSDQTFNINNSLNNAILMVRDRFASHKVEIESVLCAQNPLVCGNRYKFEHVILNLLTNARDAILERLQGYDLDRGLIQVTSVSSETDVTVLIADNGIGIAPEIQDKIYDTFFSTKSLEHGTGLGLAISLGIVRSMKAELAFDSIPGQGSTFRIVIPLVPPQN